MDDDSLTVVADDGLPQSHCCGFQNDCDLVFHECATQYCLVLVRVSSNDLEQERSTKSLVSYRPRVSLSSWSTIGRIVAAIAPSSLPCDGDLTTTTVVAFANPHRRNEAVLVSSGNVVRMCPSIHRSSWYEVLEVEVVVAAMCRSKEMMMVVRQIWMMLGRMVAVSSSSSLQDGCWQWKGHSTEVGIGVQSRSEKNMAFRQKYHPRYQNWNDDDGGGVDGVDDDNNEEVLMVPRHSQCGCIGDDDDDEKDVGWEVIVE